MYIYMDVGKQVSGQSDLFLWAFFPLKIPVELYLVRRCSTRCRIPGRPHLTLPQYLCFYNVLHNSRFS